MTSASHAEGRQLDPGWVYVMPSLRCSIDQASLRQLTGLYWRISVFGGGLLRDWNFINNTATLASQGIVGVCFSYEASPLHRSPRHPKHQLNIRKPWTQPAHPTFSLSFPCAAHPQPPSKRCRVDIAPPQTPKPHTQNTDPVHGAYWLGSKTED